MRFAFMEYKKVGARFTPTCQSAYFNLHVKIVIGISLIEHILKTLKV